MTYTIKLPVFEGPFDLLLHLIKVNEMDIHDIPISEITRQYLSYIDVMRELDLELAGEFLVMAATLIHLKARTLLPVPPEPEEQEEEISEIMSLAALKLTKAPCVLYNLNGYYDHLRLQLRHMVDMGLSAPERLENIHFAANLQEIKDIAASAE